MLKDAEVQPMLPVKDLAAAEQFYRQTLGLDEIEVMPDTALTFRTGRGSIVVYRSEFAGTNKGTAALWEVDDVEGTVEELKSRGVRFEHYDDMKDVTRKGDVHIAGPVKVAWFKDPSGNILSIQNSDAHDGR
jgi:catechol 2,3-dioxygenase-like lactoylglutathione lyase family enzyme